MTTTQRKRALAHHILCLVVAAQEANSNWAFNFKCAIVYVPELAALIGANGISVEKTEKRCKLQFINIETGRSMLNKSIVTSYDKMDLATRYIIEDFILGLEAIGNVKPFEDCPEWVSGMRPKLDYFKSNLVGKSLSYHDGWTNQRVACVVADVTVDTINDKRYVRVKGETGCDILVNTDSMCVLIAKGNATITSENQDSGIVISTWHLV